MAKGAGAQRKAGQVAVCRPGAVGGSSQDCATTLPRFPRVPSRRPGSGQGVALGGLAHAGANEATQEPQAGAGMDGWSVCGKEWEWRGTVPNLTSHLEQQSSRQRQQQQHG